MASPRFLIAALLTTLLAACGGSSLDEDVAALKTALDAESFEQVVADAPATLKRAQAESAPAATIWKIEKLHLEALAGTGEGEKVVSELSRLSAAEDSKVDVLLYTKLGSLVLNAPNAAAAVGVLDAGIKAYPEHREGFNNLIEAIKNSGDEEANAALSALGYL